MSCGQMRCGTVVADRQRLTQALVQLAQNAVQHTRTDDRISLGSALDAHAVRLWVADSGTGVSPADAGRIFERFARGGQEGGGHDGSGLGLSIVRAITEAHGGHVALSPTPGGGATFTIVVPLQAGLAAAAPTLASEVTR